MLHNIWIAKNTGECLYHRRYGDIVHDENLITSFLSAIEIFAQNVDQSCDMLQTTSYKFVYVSSKETVTVACVDKNDDENIIREEIKEIQQEFLEKFHDEIVHWSGRVEQFRAITDFVDRKLKKYTRPIIDLTKAKLELNDTLLIKKELKFSPQQEKVISLLKYKGTATLGDIVKLMRLPESEAEKAARALLYSNIIKPIQSA